MNQSNRPIITTFDQLTKKQFLLLEIACFVWTAMLLFSSLLGYFKVAFGLALALYFVLGWRKFKKRTQAKAGGTAA